MDGTETTSGHISLQDGSKTLLAPTDNNDLGTIKYMTHIDNQPTYSDVMCIVFPFGRSAMLILFSSLFFLAHAPLLEILLADNEGWRYLLSVGQSSQDWTWVGCRETTNLWSFQPTIRYFFILLTVHIQWMSKVITLLSLLTLTDLDSYNDHLSTTVGMLLIAMKVESSHQRSRKAINILICA